MFEILENKYFFIFFAVCILIIALQNKLHPTIIKIFENTIFKLALLFLILIKCETNFQFSLVVVISYVIIINKINNYKIKKKSKHLVENMNTTLDEHEQEQEQEQPIISAKDQMEKELAEQQLKKNEIGKQIAKQLLETHFIKQKAEQEMLKKKLELQIEQQKIDQELAKQKLEIELEQQLEQQKLEQQLEKQKLEQSLIQQKYIQQKLEEKKIEDDKIEKQKIQEEKIKQEKLLECSDNILNYVNSNYCFKTLPKDDGNRNNFGLIKQYIYKSDILDRCLNIYPSDYRLPITPEPDKIPSCSKDLLIQMENKYNLDIKI